MVEIFRKSSQNFQTLLERRHTFLFVVNVKCVSQLRQKLD